MPWPLKTRNKNKKTKYLIAFNINNIIHTYIHTYIKICEDGLLGVRRRRRRLKELWSPSFLGGSAGKSSTLSLHVVDDMSSLSTSGGNRGSVLLLMFASAMAFVPSAMTTTLSLSLSHKLKHRKNKNKNNNKAVGAVVLCFYVELSVLV